jgi:FAD/FMN-containing dehydrogenase
MRYRYTPLQIEKIKTISWLKSLGDIYSAESAALAKYNLKITNIIDLETAITGKIVYPWSVDYNNDRRDFNDVYPAYPIMIIYVANYEDIRASLEFARETDIMCAIRSGGHSLAGYSVCDGIVIDISALKSVYVDVGARFAVVEAGNTFGDLNPKFEGYGLHLPGGGCPTVSVAGYMQGGGYGLTSRTFGINSDCVLEITVMLADGKIVVANESQNTDLFWAVRGGTGGNFGVLLQIKYKLFELGLMWGLRITWDFEEDCTNGAKALYLIQEKYLKGDNYLNMGIETVLCTEIDNEGKNLGRKVYFGAGFIGTELELDDAIASLLEIPGATITLKKQGKYSEVNSWVLEGIPNVPMDVKAYSRSIYIAKSLSVADYINIMTYFKTSPNDYTMVDMEGYGGVINQYPLGKSAFIHRDVTMDFFCDAFFDEATHDQKQNEEWINAFFDFMAQYGNGHSYQNYPNRDQENFKWAYWGPYYNQLVVIKQKYDPNNFFHYQQSIGITLENDPDQKQIMLFNPSPIQYENY